MDTNQPIGNTKYNFAKVEFAEITQPNFTAQKNKDWVLYGDKNDYTKYLIELFNRHAEHNAIISAKTNYIAGKGLKYDKTLEDEKQKAKLDKFISYANRYQSWDDIIPMMTLDFELFNGYALQFIYGVGGKITDVYHLEFSKIRISKCGKKAYYCDNWYVSKPENDKSFACYDLYNEEIKSGTCIFYFKVHRPTALEYGSVYPIPDYIGATSAIETDINVDVFHLSNTQNGMTAQGMMSFYNGEPTREEKAKVKQMFENNYTGPNKAGKIILKFSNENEKGAEFLNFSVTDLDKQFEVLSKRLQQKIITGHKVTNPILFGIKTEGQLGNRQELIESYEHFTKTYIDVRRPNILLGVQLVAKKNDLAYNELYIEPLSPIGLEIPISEQEIAASLTFDEKRTLIAEKYSIELTAQDTDRDKRLTIVNKLGVGGTQSLMEVIKDTSISAQRKAEIINILFGININKAYKLVGFDPLTIQPTVQPTQMSADKDLILEALLNCGSEINDDEVLGSMNIECEDDAIKFESSHAHNFADVLSGDVRTVRNSILDLLAGNPSVDPEFIAKQLGLDVEYIQEQIDYMIEKSVITESVSGFTPTGKGLDKLDNIEPVETEIYTVYRYETRADVPDAKSGSREFCTKLMRAKREYTRDQINDLNNQFSTDVWRYRGGWYSNPDTGEVEKWCRHIWKGYAKVKKGAKK